MGLFKRKPKKVRAASAAIDASQVDVWYVFPAGPLDNVMTVSRPEKQAQGSHLGMQGYAPRIAVSKNRQRCEGCKELVLPNVRHICLYNAHIHLDTLTETEREIVIQQLTAALKKDGWL